MSKEFIIAQAQDAELATIVSSTRAFFREEFNFPAAELTERFDLTGSTIFPTVGVNGLAISSGTLANGKSQAKLKMQTKAPVKVQVGVLFSAVSVANCVSEIALVNKSGVKVAAFLFDATTNATQVKCPSRNSYGDLTADTTVYPIPARNTGVGVLLELELSGFDLVFRARLQDSSAAASPLATRTFRIPNPEEELDLVFSMENGLVGPASATTMFVKSLLVKDITELDTRDTSRGTTSAKDAIPAFVVNQPSTVPPLVASTRIQTTAVVLNQNVFNTTKTLVGGAIANASTTAICLRFYDKATAAALATDVPILSVYVPSKTTVAILPLLPKDGLKFSLGVSLIATGTDFSTTDATSIGASSMITLQTT